MGTRQQASRTEIPAPRFEPGAQEAGWRIERVLALEEICARLYLARHEASGARLAHVHCHDPENLFSVGFLTPPDDSRGTPHVLEHCVLAGSERYPVKDAFAELDRRSLATFLNAFTWPDRTIYPVSSAVQPDYFNLAEVYGDLVFRPLLRDETFWQEGVHLAPRDPDGESDELVWAGVVYNEMRGAYSAPEEVIERTLRQRLLPETIYRFDSGGDPDEIPALTAEQLRAFHRRCYTAENARFFLYGDVEPARNLALCAELLERAPRAAAPRLPALQPRWSEPRQVTLRYPVAPGGETRGRSFCVLAWLGPETTSAEAVLALDVVLEALVGSAAGPLRRALIDAGLGADLYPSHPFDTEQRQTIVRVGLRGTEAQHAEAIERLVLETLERVVREGLDRELVEASLHQVELAGREISQHFPVTLLTRVGRLWFYDGDPADGLRFGEQIARLRERIATEPGWLEALIRTWLLDNPHRLRLVAEPDPELAGRREAALRARLAEIAAKLDEQERVALRARAKRLRELQQRPDPPEALATLPTLSPEQIPAEVRRVPTEVREHDGLQRLEHPIFANGMVYVGLGFPLTGVPEPELPWLPILGAATTGMGAAGLDYQQMARRLLACTG
ncbi:MAG: peptidase M16, partial [Planctomycetota bacterium]